MEKYQKVGVNAFIKKGDGSFLITKRSAVNDYLPGLWDLPGGEVEFGEDSIAALSREIVEETGLRVSVGQPIFLFSEVQKEVRHQFWLIYECTYVGGEVKLNPEEHNEYKWVDIGDCEKLPKIVFLDALIKHLLS